MATDNTTAKQKPLSYEFDCESVPIPPGTKSFARLQRPGDPEPIPSRAWWYAGAVCTAAMIAGVLIGRFLLG